MLSATSQTLSDSTVKWKPDTDVLSEFGIKQGYEPVAGKQISLRSSVYPRLGESARGQCCGFHLAGCPGIAGGFKVPSWVGGRDGVILGSLFLKEACVLSCALNVRTGSLGAEHVRAEESHDSWVKGFQVVHIPSAHHSKGTNYIYYF